MHILMLIAIGLALLAAFYVFARFTGRTMRSLLPIYLVVWLIGSAINMYIGVTHAGYTIAEEALVHIPIYGVPALAAFLLSRKDRT